MKLLPMNLLLRFIIASINLSADIVPSATPTDQPMVPSGSTSQSREIALKQVKLPNLCFLSLPVLVHQITYFIFFFRNRILPIACSPLPLKFMRTKARRQVLLERLESHRQRLEQSWKIYRPSFIKTRPNWLMIPTRPRPCSRLSEA